MGHPRIDGSAAQLRPSMWCHQPTPYGARGMCRNCYSTWKREQNLGRVRQQGRKSTLLQVLRQHEITLEQYQAILDGQGGVCAICARPPVGKTRLSLDHDHKTAKLRGLLCDLCNRAIGFLQDNPERARHLAVYLEKHGRPVGVSA